MVPKVTGPAPAPVVPAGGGAARRRAGVRVGPLWQDRTVPDDDALPSQPLLRLAAAHGVVPDYWGFDGTHMQVSERTLVAVLDALGVDASSPERIDVSLTHVKDAPWRRGLPPVVVMRAGRHVHVPVHVLDGDAVDVWLELDPEAGGGRRDVKQADVYV